MTILALDSSSVSASVGVVRDGMILAMSFQNVGLTHSETLLPMLENMLLCSGLTPKDLDLVAVSNGPGSFTGLRIGVAAAMGFALSARLPCVGVSSLEAAAWGAAGADGLICAVMDARRGQVYSALFRAEGGMLTRLTDDDALPLDSVLDSLGDGTVLFVGDAAGQCADGGRRRRFAGAQYPTAFGVAQCALFGRTRPADSLNYLRLPQAERERIMKERKSEHGAYP